MIKKYPEKRYVVVVNENEDDRLTEQLDLLKDMTSNYTVECPSIDLVKDLVGQGYNAFLRYPVTDWELFYNFKELGVSDIYIDGPLCFQADRIKATKGDTKIRISPTLSPNNSMRPGLGVENFYVRPEDLHLYEGFVDIIDFKQTDQVREDTLFSIYTRGTYNYGLNTLIPTLPSVNNVLFKDEFAETRLNCGQRCKVPGRTCYYCENTFLLLKKAQALLQ